MEYGFLKELAGPIHGSPDFNDWSAGPSVQFAQRFNSQYDVDRHLFTSPEEDFFMIKLAYPEAVAAIHTPNRIAS